MNDDALIANTTPQPLFDCATALCRRGQFDQALAVLDPDVVFTSNASLLNLAAACCIALGRDDQAEHHCRRAIGIAPHYANAYNNLGIFLAGRGGFVKPKKRICACWRLRRTMRLHTPISD